MSSSPPDERRPRLHFAVPAGWLNDPNGMIFHDGEFHLFYQHNPDALVWGPMHWGHAVSRDLVRWEPLPIALRPDEHGQIFSGSVVRDAADSAGFGAGALVAIYTQWRPEDHRQVQSLAVSHDRGRSWTPYAGNPVLFPDGQRDFRDPRVLWYDTPAGGHWVMLLAVGQEVWFYRSPDLKQWTHTGRFGAEHGAHDGVWECPELLQLPVDGGPERRWVLAIGVLRGAPAGGSGTQYFVGDFDGAQFVCDDPPGSVRWADHGADFYAAQAWQPAPGGRTLWLAWMSNWEYANETPATTWRGMMTAPREPGLRRDGEGLRLTQRFAAELTAGWPARARSGPHPLGPEPLTAGAVGEAALLALSFDLRAATARRVGLRLRAPGAAPTTVAYDLGRQALVLEGAHHWLAGAARPPQVAPVGPRDGLLSLEILLDTASIELLADDGRAAITSQIFRGPGELALELFAEGGTATLAALEIGAPGA